MWISDSATSPAQQSLLHTLSCDVPFDVVYLDICSPGEVPDVCGNVKVLTFIDCMTAFAMARTMMLHAAVRWPDVADSALWPMAVDSAVHIFNHVPNAVLRRVFDGDRFPSDGNTDIALPINKSTPSMY